MSHKDKTWVQVARVISWRSHCKRARVGAVIVSADDHLISTGYNGTPKGDCNCCEDENGNTLPQVQHAEENAIINCLLPHLLCGATLYCTLSPCMHCAGKIVQVGIKKVIYIERYKNGESLSYLEKLGIITSQFKEFNEATDR